MFSINIYREKEDDTESIMEEQIENKQLLKTIICVYLELKNYC
jgi:hypothetical protein